MNFLKNRTYRLLAVELVLLDLILSVFGSFFALDGSPQFIVDIMGFLLNILFWFGIPVFIVYPPIYLIKRMRAKKNLDREAFYALYGVSMHQILTIIFLLFLLPMFILPTLNVILFW